MNLLIARWKQRGVRCIAKAVMVVILQNVLFALRALACVPINVFNVMRTFLIVLLVQMARKINAQSVIIRLPIYEMGNAKIVGSTVDGR